MFLVFCRMYLLVAPFELCTDGDLLTLIPDFIRKRDRGTVRITNVKGHADEGMVLDGKVRALDKAGIDLADRAADFGRRRLSPGIIDAKRLCLAACREWYPIVSDLHRFFNLVPGLLSMMMVMAVPPRIRLFGIGRGGGKEKACASGCQRFCMGSGPSWPSETWLGCLAC